MPAAKSITILVVDDQQTMRGLARQCLKKLGVTDVALAASGDAAFDLMQTKKFDAVISDLNMPGISGIDLAQKIKSHPALSSTPVFLATSESYRDQAEGSLVDHFVSKPFSVSDVRDALETHLGELS